VCDNVYIIVIY